MRKTLALAFFVALFSESCTTRIPVTWLFLDEMKKEGIPLEKLQFYNTYPFEARAKKNDSDITLKAGELNIKNESTQKIIKFGSNTPCVFISQSQDQQAIELLFDKNYPSVIFNINTNQNDRANYGRYQLNSSLVYNGQSTVQKSRTPVQLYVRKSQVNKRRYEVKRAKGVRVTE
jgi:hypothetical protein